MKTRGRVSASVPALAVAAWLGALWLGAFSSTRVLAQSWAALRATLEEVPRPDLSREEKAIRDQLEGSRALVDRLSAGPATTRERLAEAYGRLGGLYLMYEMGELSGPALRNAMLLEAEDHRWVYLLAVGESRAGRFAEAERLLRRVLEIESDHLQTHLRLGDLLLDRGESREGERHYRRALELDPGSAAALAGLGRLRQQQGQHLAAIELLERALELSPGADSLHHTIGMSYRSLGEREKARAHLALNRHGRLTFPDPLIEALAAENLSSVRLFRAGNDAMRRGDMEQAELDFAAYLEVESEDAVAHHNLGLVLLALDRREEALTSLRRAVELEPDYRGGHFSLGSALAEQGRLEEGLVHYRRAHQIDPEEPVIHADYATLLAKVGRAQEGLSELEALLARDPTQDYARLKYGGLLALLGRSSQARTALGQVATSSSLTDELRAEAYFHLGVIASNDGDDERARPYWKRSLELDPESGDAAAALALSLARAGQFAASAKKYDLALDLHQDDGREDESLHMGRAMALILGASYAAAQAALEESLGSLPQSLLLRHLLARLLATCPDAGVRDGARALELARQVTRERHTLEHGETLAMALAEAGRFEEAVEVQRQVVEQAAASGLGESASQAARRRRLEGYRQHRPVRAPWLDGS